MRTQHQTNTETFRFMASATLNCKKVVDKSDESNNESTLFCSYLIMMTFMFTVNANVQRLPIKVLIFCGSFSCIMKCNLCVVKHRLLLIIIGN